MKWWSLNEEQGSCLAEHTRGLVVVDLGAGDGTLTKALSSVCDVTGVDTKPGPDGVKWRSSGFKRFKPKPGSFDVAVLAWPVNNGNTMIEVIRILKDVPKAVLLVKNTDGTICGLPDLFRYLLRRDLLQVVPSERNTLLVYGGHRLTPRKPEFEEKAGMDYKYVYYSDGSREKDEYLA